MRLSGQILKGRYDGIILLVVLMMLGTGKLNGQLSGWSFDKAYATYRQYYYQPLDKWRSIREGTFSRTGLEDSLRQYTRGKVYKDVICPWWVEDLYRPDVIQARFQRIGYVGYVLDPLTGSPLLTNSWNDSTLFGAAWQNIPVDLVVYCNGADAFDYFLKCDSARLTFLKTVFDPEDGLINKRHFGRRPAGLHFYLPNFSFREKKAFMRFVCAVSMVIDHYCRNEERPYAGDKCWLTFTFSPSARNELDYLSGVLGLADEIHFVTYDEYGLPVATPEVYTYRNDPTSVLYRVYNQFYLFSFFSDVVSDTECCSDIARLSQASYSEHNWKFYLLLDFALVLALIISVLAYNLYSPFYMLVERYRSFIIPVLITLVTEIIIVFLYMVEALSPNELLFSLDEGTHLYLLALPLLFIVLHIGLKMLGGRRELP